MFFHSRELVGEKGTSIFVRNVNMWAGPYSFKGFIEASSLSLCMFLEEMTACTFSIYWWNNICRLLVHDLHSHDFFFLCFSQSSQIMRFFPSLLSFVWVLSQPAGFEWWILHIKEGGPFSQSTDSPCCKCCLIQKTHSYAFLHWLLGWIFCTIPNCYVWSLVACFYRVRGCYLLERTSVHVLNNFAHSFFVIEAVNTLRDSLSF